MHWFGFITVVACLGLSHAAEPMQARPLVGAIRWDAWYSDKGPVKEVERTLGQPKYHFRLPWFAEVQGGDKVRINGDTDEVMRREIAYASEAGLDYWAFLDYGPGSDMTHAFDRYLKANDKRGLRYCFIEEGGSVDGRGPKGWPRVIEHFKDQNYLKVLDGRPLLFVFGLPKKYGREVFDELARLTVEAGLKRPYLVLMGWNPIENRERLGFDAVSEYGLGKGYTADQWPYSKLVEHVETNVWGKWKQTKTPCITFATAGWDTRPRDERPPTWCKWITAKPDPTPPEKQVPLVDEVTAKPSQIAQHVKTAVQWTQANRDLNPAGCIIIYGWNENDEGGWLIPTLNADGTANEDRIKALRSVLRNDR